MCALYLGEIVKNDDEEQRMRANNLLISPKATPNQVEAVERFLAQELNFETLLVSLGLQRSPRFTRNPNGLNKLDQTLKSKLVPQLRLARSKEFPEDVKQTLRELDCPLLWIQMPKTAKIVTDVEIVEGLARQLKDACLEFGEVLGDFFQGRHDLSQYFDQAVQAIKEWNEFESEIVSSELTSFSFGFFSGLKRVPVDQVALVFETLDPQGIMELDRLLKSAGLSIGASRTSGIEDPNKQIFLAISRRILDEDFERQIDPEKSFEFHGSFDPDWDSWIATKLQSYLEKDTRSTNDPNSKSPFNFKEYLQMRDAFSPYRFPKTAAALVHVAYRWFELKLEDLTFEVLESLVSDSDSDSDKVIPAIAFLEAVLNDQSILNSKKALRLLDSIEQVLTNRNYSLGTTPDLDLSTKYEAKFAATIASANRLSLNGQAEAVISRDPISSSIYLSGGRPSFEFIREAIGAMDVDPYNAILSRIADHGFEPPLDLEDLQTIKENFDTVLATSLARGLRNSPGDKAGKHFENAKTLSNLFPHLVLAINSHSCFSNKSDLGIQEPPNLSPR